MVSLGFFSLEFRNQGIVSLGFLSLRLGDGHIVSLELF